MAEHDVGAAEAYEFARRHEHEEKRLRAQGERLIARAEHQGRWAAKWRDWASGEVPYPGPYFGCEEPAEAGSRTTDQP